MHQGTVINPLLLPVVLGEVTKDIREWVFKDLIYADDLPLLRNSWEKVES